MAEASRDMGERRRQAKEAMEGPERAERRRQREARIETKRKQAALSMEGPEQRTKRLAREKKIKEKEETIRTTEETKKKAVELEELRRREKEELTKTEEERHEQAEQARLEEMRKSEETITAIRSKPISMNPLRTFKSDMARVLRGGASEASIAMAEDKKRRMAIPIKKESHKRLKIIISVFALLFIAGGSGLLIYAFVLLPKKEPPITPIENPVISSIITVEKNKKIDVTALSSDALRESLIKENIPVPAVGQNPEQIYFVERKEEMEKRLTSLDFIQKIGLKMPSILLRSIEKEFMYGINRSADSSSFIILKTASPQNAFSGMLAWEKGMAADLYALINGKNPPPELLRQKFDDRLVRNIDTRALMGTTGEILFLYSVIDGKKVIVIAKDEKVLMEILSRLQ